MDEANNTSPNSVEGSARTLKEKVIPSVIFTNPVQNAEDVALNSDVEFLFNISMVTESVENAIEITPTTEYSTIWSESNTRLKINFSQNLLSNTTYKVTIKSSKSVDGLDLENAPYTLTFKTIEIIEMPKVEPNIYILNPIQDSIVRPREMLKIAGTSIGLENGTEIRVYIGDSSKLCLVDIMGNWSINFKAPEIEGLYSIIAKTENLTATVFIYVEKVVGPDKDVDPDDNSTNTSKKDNNGKKDIKNKHFLSVLLDNYIILVCVFFIIIIMAFLLVKNKRRKKPTDFRKIIDSSKSNNDTSKDNLVTQEQNIEHFDGLNNNSDSILTSEFNSNGSTIEPFRDPTPGNEGDMISMQGVVGMKGFIKKSKKSRQSRQPKKRNIKDIKRLKKGPSNKLKVKGPKRNGIEKPEKSKPLPIGSTKLVNETDIKNDDNFIQNVSDELHLTDNEVDPIDSVEPENHDFDKNFEDMLLGLEEFGELLADIENNESMDIPSMESDFELFNISEPVNDLDEFDGEL
jgi:hypothetical protein